MTFDVREHHTKYEHLIPMRDGVRLFTSVLVPKDDARLYPILLMRTPFEQGRTDRTRTCRSGVETGALLEARYTFVRQDVRGRW